MAQLKKIAILGSTGSIGTQALDVVSRHPERFQVVGLAGGGNVDLLAKQVQQFTPRVVSVRREQDAQLLRSFGNGKMVFWGDQGAVRVVEESGADVVLSAIVGAAGLPATFRAIQMGKTVALANKESLVIAGQVMTDEAGRSGARILPVDSEHSAIFQCLIAGRREEVRRLVLTASGGPFLHRSKESLGEVTVEEALRHPNWKMGDKITVDSATLMNKGLELIEAHWLFGFPPAQIEVQIHPQSIVHSMVEFCDGSVVAQLGPPDMRTPISYALAYPDRIESGVKNLSLSQVGPLTFMEPDLARFPCLQLAREVVSQGGSLPVVLNAANEVVVGRFLRREIKFLEIPQLIARALEGHARFPLKSLEDVLEVDRQTRESLR